MDRIENNRHLKFFTRKADSSDTQDQIQRHDPDFHKNNIRLIPASGFLKSIQTTVEKIQSFD